MGRRHSNHFEKYSTRVNKSAWLYPSPHCCTLYICKENVYCGLNIHVYGHSTSARGQAYFDKAVVQFAMMKWPALGLRHAWLTVTTMAVELMTVYMVKMQEWCALLHQVSSVVNGV